MESERLRVVAIAGSLRRESYNRRLVQAAREVAPDSLEIARHEISAIPLYDGDVEKAGFPSSVQALREAIRRADGVLIATPEYNYSVPGVLKNAIDWVSRPPDQPFRDKPVAIIGATPGGFGTTRAQHHLRQSFVFLDARVLARPELLVASAADKFDAKGDLVDEKTRKLLGELLVAFEAWARRLR
jgi:chromate reductase